MTRQRAAAAPELEDATAALPNRVQKSDDCRRAGVRVMSEAEMVRPRERRPVRTEHSRPNLRPLKSHPHLHLIRARRDEVRAAERRQEVVQRFLVRQVQTLNRTRSFVLSPRSRLSAPKPRSNKWRGAMRGGLFTSSRSRRPGSTSAWRLDLPECTARDRRTRASRPCCRRTGRWPPAGPRSASARSRSRPTRSGDEARIVAPAERRPRTGRLVERVLEVRRRVELLIVVDAEVALAAAPAARRPTPGGE